MKLFLAVILILALAQAARADEFTARVAAGRAAAATPAGDEFGLSVTPMLQSIDSLCDPPGMILPAAELGPLDLVGDITPTGALTNVEIRPQTAVGECFAKHLAARHFAPPPWQGNYPLFVHLVVSN
jgi:hypothetical protein